MLKLGKINAPHLHAGPLLHRQITQSGNDIRPLRVDREREEEGEGELYILPVVRLGMTMRVKWSTHL